jgi:subtilisin family serine protease
MGGGIDFFGGTSAASPYAAGQAALLLQDDPSLQPESIRDLLRANGPLVTNPENGLSFPRSDVEAAIGLPEPSGTLLLLSGATFLAVLGRRRYAP